MLDIWYPNLRAFVRECRNIRKYIANNARIAKREYDANAHYIPRVLLEQGKYKLMSSGNGGLRVVATEFF